MINYLKKIIFIILTCLTVFTSIANYDKRQVEEDIVSLLDKSENYYWAALDNGGYKRLLIESRKYLIEAENLFENNKNQFDDGTLSKIALQVESLSVDLESQETMYAKKFSTRYGMTKFLGMPLIMSGGVINNHFFYYSPTTTTIKKGISTVIDLVRAVVEGDRNSQFDVVILANKKNQSRVGFLAHAFDNAEGVFYTLTTRYINNILSQNASAKTTQLFLDGNLTKEAIDILSSKLSERQLLVVSFDQMAANPGDEFYNVYGDIYDSNGEKIHSIATMSFGFSHSDTLSKSAVVNLLLLLASFIVAVLLYKFWNYNNTLNIKIILFTSFYGFLLGRVTSWIAMPALSQFSPPTDKASYDNLPMLLFSIPSYLWLIAIALTVFVLPILVPRLISHPFLKKYANLPSVSGKGAYFGIGAAHGIAAYISFPLLINFEYSQLALTLPIYIALLLGGYILGRSILDERDAFSEKYSIPIIAGFVVFAFPLLGSDLDMAIYISIIIIAIAVYIIYQVVRLGHNNISSNIVVDVEEASIESTHDVVKLTENPIYKRFSNYLTILDEAKSNLFDSKTNYLAISGPIGSGKTVALKNLISDINKNTKSRLNMPVLYFHGECKTTDHNESGTPYDVFHQALGSTLSLDLFDQRSQNDMINSAISSASKLLLGPVGCVLSASVDDDTPSFSDDDIYAFIQEKLVELSKKSIVIFHLDDIQWIDEKSKDLLSKLLAYFESGDSRVLFLLGLRNDNDNRQLLQSLNINTESVKILSKLNPNEQNELLMESIHLSEETANWISSWLSQRDEGQIYPADLVDAVDHLARSGFFIETDDGFSLSKDFDKSNPPIPNGVKDAVREIINNNLDVLNIISIAAYIGKEFTVSIISQCLKISRLDTIDKLDQLSNDTGLIYDVLNKDDVYSFRSQAYLDAVRLSIEYTNDGSNVSTVPQSARNFHALIASSIQDSNTNNPDDVMAIARHYFAAGSIYAEKSLVANIAAAKLASRFHQFDNAESLLEKARISCESSGQSAENIAIQQAVLVCEKSHIYGKGQSAAADAGLALLKDDITSGYDKLTVVIVRALYESRRYDEAINLAEKLKGCESLVIQAEGYHFHGLSFDPKKYSVRLKLLRKAYELSEQSNQSGLFAMVANSLAGQLSKGSTKERDKAKKLYFKSLEIKEAQDIKDIKGMAMTHGGLGFFYFFGKPQDLESARTHFEKDLELATQISGEMGMSKMNSMLSQIDLLEDKAASAVQRSIAVLNLNNNPLDASKAIEVLCKIAKIELPKDFNQNDVNLCEYLKKIYKVLSSHEDSDISHVVRDIETYLNNRCN